MNQITIRKQDIDWKKVIDLAFKRQDWGKKYTLYSRGRLTVQCEMSSIDFKRSTASIEITTHYADGDNSWSTCWDYVQYFMNNFTVENLENLINKKIISILERKIEQMTEELAAKEYKDIYYDSWDIGEKEIEEQGYIDDYNQLQELNNDSIKEAGIDALKDQVVEEMNLEYETKVAEYVEDNLIEIEDVTELLNHLREETL